MSSQLTDEQQPQAGVLFAEEDDQDCQDYLEDKNRLKTFCLADLNTNFFKVVFEERGIRVFSTIGLQVDDEDPISKFIKFDQMRGSLMVIVAGGANP
jgi:hypothetical protein